MPTKQEVTTFVKDVSISLAIIAAGMTVIYITKSNIVLAKENFSLRGRIDLMNGIAHDAGLLDQLIEYSRAH